MPIKLNAFVCDGCRICCGRSVDDYPIENGWSFSYERDSIRVRVYCPKCTQVSERGELFKDPNAHRLA